jgi:predicted exporter
MISPRLRIFLLWLLLMCGGVAVVANSRFSTDISFFLPSRPTPEQQVLVDQLQDGSVSRLLMLAVAGGDERQRAVVSKAMRKGLVAGGQFVSVQNGEAAATDAERAFFLRYRYQLSPAVDASRFSENGLRDAVGNTIQSLASPMGFLIKPFLAQDPTGELLAVLDQLNPGAQPEMRAGVWASRDGERAMMLLETRAQGSDIDGQADAIELVRRAFEEAKAAQPADVARALTMQLSGPGLFAVQSRESIKAEVSKLLLISTLGIVGVLLWAYRSPRLLALGLLPMLSGALVGAVVVSWVYGTVFGITVGFGSALIGEAVDYAIYFFVQSGRLGLAHWRRSFWPTIRLGVMTSALGFGALLFSGFPGLAQLGLYALSGVVTAALVTRFMLPALAGQVHSVPEPGRWVTHALVLLGQAYRLRIGVLLLAVAAGGYLWVQRDNLWGANLSALSTVTDAQGANDGRLRADLAAPDARYLVLVSGADRETALQAAEQVGDQLDGLVREGVIGGYDSPVRFLPSAQRQARRLAALPESAVLQDRLQAALVDSPLSASKLGPFVDDVAAARLAGPLQRKDLDGTAMALAVDAMLTQGPKGWNVMLPLRPPADEGDMPVTRLEAALTGSGALFVDMKGEFDTLYGGYVSEAMRLSLAGCALIVLLLAVTLRSPMRLARVLLTLALTVTGVIAALHLAGERLHLLHLVGMLLIVAVGSNYALFFDRAAGGEPLDAATLMSLCVATMTTAIGFGTLAASHVPVLNAIGMTVGPGALLALVLAAVFVYPPQRR